MIQKNWDSFEQSCLRRAEGDQMKADYLMNCGFHEYYNRLLQYNKYTNWLIAKQDEKR